MDYRLSTVTPCLLGIQLHFRTDFRRTPGPDDDIEGLVGRFRQQLWELFPTLYESEVAVQCSLLNAYMNF